ncbi:MAG: hypothetical protein ACNA8S_15810 [Deferrisomatales bacterium]
MSPAALAEAMSRCSVRLARPAPPPADAKAIIAACRKAGLEWLSPDAIEANASLGAVAAIIARVQACQAVATKGGLGHPSPALLRAWARADAVEITRQVMNAARPREDDILGVYGRY